MAELARAPLEVSVKQVADETIITVAGELDLSNVAVLRRVVDGQVAEAVRRAAFDLSDLTFMDSSGIALLVTTKRRLAEIRVVNPSPQVRRLITMTGLSTILGIEE